MIRTCQEVVDKTADEASVVCLDFSGHLFPGEVLASADDLTVAPTGELSGAIVGVNEVAIPHGARTVAIGHGVLVRLTGGVATKKYKVTVRGTTNASPTQIRRGAIDVIVAPA